MYIDNLDTYDDRVA